MIKIVYLARLRDTFGQASEQLQLPIHVKTIADLRQWLRARGGAWAIELDDHRPVRAAVNQVMANGDTVLAPNDEIAFFPPVTGG